MFSIKKLSCVKSCQLIIWQLIIWLNRNWKFKFILERHPVEIVSQRSRQTLQPMIHNVIRWTGMGTGWWAAAIVTPENPSVLNGCSKYCEEKKNPGRPFSLKERVSFPARDPAKKRGLENTANRYTWLDKAFTCCILYSFDGATVERFQCLARRRNAQDVQDTSGNRRWILHVN